MMIAGSMNDFAALPYDEQRARFDALAARALNHFGLAGADCTLINAANNAVYQVTAGAARYALRVHRPGLKRLRWIESEQTWLRALAADMTRIPRPAADLYTGALKGLDAPVYVALFHWVDGVYRTPSQITPDAARDIGAFIGHLQNASAAFNPPPGFERPTLDFAGLFGAHSPYNPGPAGEALFSADQRAVMQAAAAQVQASMAALHALPGGFGLIHADLIWKNILFDDDGQVGAIDFDDCAYGYALYDLAPMLLAFRDEPNGAELSLTLWAGYTSVRPQPPETAAHLEALVAARHIASIRWLAGNVTNPAADPGLRARAPELIAQRIARLHHFLTNGKL